MIQPKITPEDDKKLSELAALEEFESNRSSVVRVAIRELYERRLGREEK
ncbi:ribbon-helix-helix protein, CopG family [Sorangium sp. So ce693]